MKFEYKKKSKTKNDVGRIIISMTPKEAYSILNSILLAQRLSQRKLLDMPEHRFRRGVLDYVGLYETEIIVEDL